MLKHVVYFLMIGLGFTLAQERPSWLVGQWRIGDEVNNISFVLQADGGATLSFTEDGEEDSISGSWQLMGGELQLSFEGEQLRLTVEQLAQDSIRLRGGDFGEEGLDLINIAESPNVIEPVANATNPLTGQADPFVGQFVGQEITLELYISDSSYAGTLNFQGNTYPVKAQAQTNLLSGVFTAGEDFAFEASLSGTSLLLTSGGTDYQLEKQTTMVTPAPQVSQGNHQRHGLVGKWIGTGIDNIGEPISYELSFLPDGYYIYIKNEFLNNVRKEGFYSLNGQEITFRPWCTAAETYVLQHQGNTFSLANSEQAYEHPNVYTFEVGSESRVLEDFRQLEAERSINDQIYLARTPLISVQVGLPSNDPTLPADASLNNVFGGATVFAEDELYAYISDFYFAFDFAGNLRTVLLADVMFNSGLLSILTGDTYRDNSYYALFPNGRVYHQVELYSLPVSTDPLVPQTEAFWSRYRIDGNDLIVEHPEGEKVLSMIDGRRILSSDGLCFNEKEWFKEKNQ